MGNPVYFLFWLIVLVVISFFVGFVGGFLYIWTYLFSACIKPCSDIANFFLKCVQFPGYCANAMLSCQKPC